MKAFKVCENNNLTWFFLFVRDWDGLKELDKQ